MYTGVLEIAWTPEEKVHIAMTHLLPKQRRVSVVPMSTNPMRRLLTFSQATTEQELDTTTRKDEPKTGNPQPTPMNLYLPPPTNPSSPCIQVYMAWRKILKPKQPG